MICLSSLSIRDNFLPLRLFEKDKVNRLENAKNASTMVESFVRVAENSRHIPLNLAGLPHERQRMYFPDKMLVVLEFVAGSRRFPGGQRIRCGVWFAS
jgi:hypothetical protein